MTDIVSEDSELPVNATLYLGSDLFINVSFVGARLDSLEVAEGDVLPVLRTHYSIV
jgi:hypothetical protein